MAKSRKSLSVRLQPYEGTPMAEVADYLNGLDAGTMQRKIEDLLVLGLLSYARLEQETSPEKLRLTCLECCDGLEKHAATLRLAIGVEPTINQPKSAVSQPMNDPGDPAPAKAEMAVPTRQSIAKQIGSVFGDDD
jgi:hypothetical protein